MIVIFQILDFFGCWGNRGKENCVLLTWSLQRNIFTWLKLVIYHWWLIKANSFASDGLPKSIIFCSIIASCNHLVGGATVVEVGKENNLLIRFWVTVQRQRVANNLPIRYLEHWWPDEDIIEWLWMTSSFLLLS